MPNRIREVAVINHRLDPTETELHIYVTVERLTPTTEIKGRLMGPRCVYSSTVEVAYTMREIARSDHIVLRVIIPEPCWWDPQSPFLYQGPIELWQDGQLCERLQVSHGIRWVQSSSRGLLLNGRPYVLRGKVVAQNVTEAEARQFHDDGINAVLMTLLLSGSDLWTKVDPVLSLADRYGFFVVGRPIIPSDFLFWRNKLNAHPSCLGWVLDPGLTDELARQVFEKWHHQSSMLLCGVETTASIPSQASFVICQEDELPALTSIDRPKLVLAKHLPEALPSRPDVIGWIETK